MNRSYLALPDKLDCYAKGNMEGGVVLELAGKNDLVRRVRFRLATVDDLDELYKVEQASWPEELALSREEIEESLTDFVGLQIIALNENSKETVGWASVTRVSTEAILGDVNDWENSIHGHISAEGKSFEGLGIAVTEEERGYHLGQSLIIFASRATARSLVLENRINDEFAHRLTGRASGYGKWLEERSLGASTKNLKIYVNGVRSGEWRDPVLSMNFSVVESSAGLVEEVELVPNSWLIDKVAKGAGVRFDRTKLTQAFIPIEKNILAAMG